VEKGGRPGNEHVPVLAHPWLAGGEYKKRHHRNGPLLPIGKSTDSWQKVKKVKKPTHAIPSKPSLAGPDTLVVFIQVSGKGWVGGSVIVS
jgi:hypothetical protein